MIVLSKVGFLCEVANFPILDLHSILVYLNMKCTGTTKAGLQCQKNALRGRDFCHLHIKCQGICRDGGRCNARAVKDLDYLYCREDHVPTNNQSSDPKMFRIDGLRHSKRDAVLEWRGRKDAYTEHTLESIEGLELDHVVELHIVRDAYDAIPKHGMDFEKNKKELMEFTRDSVVNEESNLNFTSKRINEWKFKAFYEFQKDYRSDTGKKAEEGLFPYLEDGYNLKTAGGKKKRFSRNKSRRIQTEVKKSFQYIISVFEDDQPLHGHMMDKLDASLAAMRLTSIEGKVSI